MYRLLTALHEVGECANLISELEEVRNGSRSFVPGGLVKSREIRGALLAK